MGRRRRTEPVAAAASSSSSFVTDVNLPKTTTRVGFGGYMEKNSLVDDCYIASEIDDGDLAQHFKGLSHKHPPTKLKSLASLSQLIRQKSSVKIVNFMPRWAFIYKKLLVDYDRQVRQAAHVTMTDVVSALGRDMSPHLKTLIGPWWFSQFDSAYQVSQAAKRLFKTAFPDPGRRRYAIVLCYTEIFTYIEENLKVTPQSLSALTSASDETEQMHQQVLSSSLLALGALLDAFCYWQSSSESVMIVLMNATKARIVDISVVKNSFRTNNYFIDYLKSQSPVVRSAAHSVVKSCIKNIPHAIKKEDMKLVAAAIFDSFQEKNPVCHSAMWETLLELMKTFPESWNNVDVEKTILNPFRDFLKNACFGSQKVSYPVLVLFLETVPQHAITGDKFFLDFFRNIWAARNLSYSSNADRHALFSAVEECLCWCLRNASRYCDGVDAIYRFRRRLIDEILLGLLWHEYMFAVGSKYQNLICPARGYEESIAECIIKILSAVHCAQRDLLLVYYMRFQADCLDIFSRKEDNLSKKANWVVRFILLLDQHAVQQGETWPFDLVGIVLKAYFPLIQQLDSPDSVQLLEVAVSIFGPVEIVCEITGTTDSGTENFLRSFNECFVPWCLKVYSASTQARLDFLFTLLLEESFFEQWDAIVKHLFNSVTTCANNGIVDQGHLSVFACLIKMARERIGRKDSAQSILSKWRHDLLDSVAISVVRAIPPYGNSQFISAVLGGRLEDEKSFLSRSTEALILEQVLNKLLLFMMDSTFVWVRDVCNFLLVSGTTYSGSKVESSKSLDMAYFALDILIGSTFCLKILEDVNEELTEGILSALFIIDWEFNFITEFKDEPNEEQFGNINSRLAFGGAVHAFLCRVSDQVLKGFDANRRHSLGTKLMELAKRTVFIDDSISTFTCCKWVHDIFKVLCVDQTEQQQLFDKLLSKNEWWPMWIMPDAESSTENVVQGEQVSKNTKFLVLIDEVIPKVGFDQLVARPWLAAEILCTWNWIGGIAMDSFLPWFARFLNDRDYSDQIIYMLLDGAIAHGSDCDNSGLNHLLSPASFEEIGSVNEPFLRALLSLLFIFLQDDVWGKEKTFSFILQLSNKLDIRDHTSVNLNCLRILPSVLNILLRHLGTTQLQDQYDPSNQTDFHHVTVHWLETIISAAQTGRDTEDWLELIIACFPIKETETGFGLEPERYALPIERSLLYKLFRKHKVRGVNKEFLLSVQIQLSKLMVISVAYCWEYFDDDDWIFFLFCLSRWIRPAIVLVEENTKNINDIVHTYMNGSDVGGATLLGKLRNTVVINDHSTIQLATNVLGAFSNFVALDLKKYPRKLVTERMEPIVNLISEGILRLLFVTAAAEAIADSYGNREASSVIGSSRFDHQRLWELVGSCAVHSSSSTRKRAMESVQVLKSSKGPISSLYALLFSLEPLPPLQSAAFALLSTEPIVCSALTFDIYDVLSCNIYNLDTASSDAGICCVGIEISCELERTDLDVFKTDLLAQKRVNVFVAWGLVLSCLTLTRSSVVSSERIIQYVQEFTGSVILDCLTQHIQCTDDTGSSSRTAGLAAKRAVKTGSALFAIKSLWPIEQKSMASLSGAIFGLMLFHLPSYVRRWFEPVKLQQSPGLSLFIKTWCSPEIISSNISLIRKSHLAVAAHGNLSVSVREENAGKEVVATYTKDETQMFLIFRYPPTYPLKPVSIESEGSLGVSHNKLKEWLTSLTSFICNQNGSIDEAIKIWTNNIDKEFEGVEDCPICYLVIHPADLSHPNFACNTCKHKFHRDCLSKWFSAARRTCPMCRSYCSILTVQH